MKASALIKLLETMPPNATVVLVADNKFCRISGVVSTETWEDPPAHRAVVLYPSADHIDLHKDR